MLAWDLDLENYIHFAQIFLLYILLLSPLHILIHWFIHWFIHSSCQHVLNTYHVLDSRLNTTISAAIWLHNDWLAPLFYSVSVSSTETSAISRAPRVGITIHSTPYQLCHSCCCWLPLAPQHPLLPNATPIKFLI